MFAPLVFLFRMSLLSADAGISLMACKSFVAVLLVGVFRVLGSLLLGLWLCLFLGFLVGFGGFRCFVSFGWLVLVVLSFLVFVVVVGFLPACVSFGSRVVGASCFLLPWSF